MRHMRSIPAAVAALSGATLAALTTPASARAQMPGAPVLQNAFATPGIVAAANVGGGDGTVYAGAVAWTPGSGRFQLSAGAGSWTPTGGGGRFVYGARVAAPLFSLMGGGLGIGVFAGVGSAAKSGDEPRGPTQVPVGASIGYRKALGATRGLSLYAAPMYMAVTAQGLSAEHVFRASFGLDVALTSSLGVTAGAETGQTGKTIAPANTRWGVALSYALGHR